MARGGRSSCGAPGHCAAAAWTGSSFTLPLRRLLLHGLQLEGITHGLTSA